MTEWKYDLFISHASEDKAELVYPLATALAAAGIRVWYDEFSLLLGDNLRQSIDKGLAQSRYGVVVLSKAFFGKQWPQWEIDGLLQRQLEGKKVILPLWHKVKATDVKEYSLSLANLKGASTDDGLGPVIDQILDVVATDAESDLPTTRKKPAESPTAEADRESVSRLEIPIRGIEPCFLEYAAALKADADASAQSLLRKHPEMFFQLFRGRGSFVRTHFQLGTILFDAIQLREMQIIQATLITLGPVSEPPFDASGAWSSELATAAGRIAAARRWIVNNRKRLHSSLREMVQAEIESNGDLDSIREMTASFIRPGFLILAGRRASINEEARQRFHESFEEATLLSYDSILHSVVREEFVHHLSNPVFVKAVPIKPGQELAVSVDDGRLKEVLESLEQSLKPLLAGTSREVAAIAVALAGESEPRPGEHPYAFKPGNMSVWVRTDRDFWIHPAHWFRPIYRGFDDAIQIVSKVPGRLVHQTVEVVIRSVAYKEHLPELQEWERDDKEEHTSRSYWE